MVRKKLIEVALPLDAINRESAREKSIRHGHPSTLHLWWARRPLAACRAVLFSSLVDDPDSDPAYTNLKGELREQSVASKRAQLFDLIETLVKWENSNDETVINAARAEIARCVASRKIEVGELKATDAIRGGATVGDLISNGHGRINDIRAGRWRLPPADAVNSFLAEFAPPVLDPFCGGGSIPLEAQRLGLRAFASDLNPVPVLITKALIEIPPNFAGRPPLNPVWQQKSANEKAATIWRGANGLAEDVRYYGQWMRDEAARRIGRLYPKVKITPAMAADRADLKPLIGQELTVIAWLWARTVPSPDPALGGAPVPLVRSFWLSTKQGKDAWVEPVVDGNRRGYRFEVRTGTFPKSFDPAKGTVSRKGGICLLSKGPMPFPHIRSEAKAGRMGVRLMAIVAEGTRGRVYLPPQESHVEIAESARPTWRPEGEMPKKHRNFQPPVYGMNNFGDLFTPRQLVALTTFSDLVMAAREQVLADARAGAAERHSVETAPSDAADPAVSYADAVATYLGMAVSRSANTHCTMAIWSTGRSQSINAFGRQAIPMTWDFPEVNPFADAAGDLRQTFASMTRVIEGLPTDSRRTAPVRQADAARECDAPKPRMYATDPPYYDNIGYADLSDFFYVWLRRSLGGVYPELFRTVLTPKAEELIAAPYRHNGSKEDAMNFFEDGLGRAFLQMRNAEHPDYPLTVYYAFKQSETEEGEPDEEKSDSSAATASTGWETMLEGLLRAGLAITGTWPMRTERDQGLKTGDNVLASSIVLVCHPRATDAAMATRKDFVAALKKELPAALRDLQSGNIAPVDLAQAAIGPGMAIYSCYSKVINSDGSRMPVRTALQLINQILDEVLAEQEGDFDADSRWAIAWFEQHGFAEGEYGVAETLSKAKNTSVNGLAEAGILESRRGKVRLLKPSELPANWDPAADTRLTAWETVHHVIRVLETGGETAAAELVAKLGSSADVVRELGYRLYNSCERRKRATEALAYNGLVQSWPEISRLARESDRGRERQVELFERE